MSKYKSISNYKNQFRSFNSTTFCAKSKGEFWCTSSHGRLKCLPQSCRRLYLEAIMIGYNSVQLNIVYDVDVANRNNFLLLYNDEFTECRLFYNYTNKEVEEFTRRQYQLCKKQDYKSVRNMTITGLLPTTQYRLFYVEIKKETNYLIKFNFSTSNCEDDGEIVTRIGHKDCVPYKISKFKYINSMSYKNFHFNSTTFCSLPSDGDWCPTYNSTAKCLSQQCRLFNPADADIGSRSIYLNIPRYSNVENKNNFLFLYNDNFTECQLFYNYRNKEVEEFTRLQYQLCKKQNYKSVREITIYGLVPKRKYRLYYVEITKDMNYFIKFVFYTKSTSGTADSTMHLWISVLICNLIFGAGEN